MSLTVGKGNRFDWYLDRDGSWPIGCRLTVTDPASFRFATWTVDRAKRLRVVEDATGEPIEPGSSGFVMVPRPGTYRVEVLDP